MRRNGWEKGRGDETQRLDTLAGMVDSQVQQHHPDDRFAIGVRAFIEACEHYGISAYPCIASVLVLDERFSALHARHGTMPDEQLGRAWIDHDSAYCGGIGFGQGYIEEPEDGTYEHLHLVAMIEDRFLADPAIRRFDSAHLDERDLRRRVFPLGLFPHNTGGFRFALPSGGQIVYHLRTDVAPIYEDLPDWKNDNLRKKIVRESIESFECWVGIRKPEPFRLAP